MLNKGKDHVVNRNIVTEVQEVYRFKECENSNSNIAVFACNNTDKGNDDDVGKIVLLMLKISILL